MNLPLIPTYLSINNIPGFEFAPASVGRPGARVYARGGRPQPLPGSPRG